MEGIRTFPLISTQFLLVELKVKESRFEGLSIRFVVWVVISLFMCQSFIDALGESVGQTST